MSILKENKLYVFNENIIAHYVDDWNSTLLACNILKRQRVIAIDMEGRNFGKKGIISLLQIAISTKEIFVFDVLAIGPSLFSGHALLPILTDPEIVKLCYDCRCDAEALSSSYGIRVWGFYDLQIVYTLMFQNKQDPFLKGLHRAMKVPGIIETESLAEAHISRKQATKKEFDQGNYLDRLFQRPIDHAMLEYSCIDVIHLFAMYSQWNIPVKHILAMTNKRIIRFLTRTPYQVQNTIMSKLDFTLPLDGYHKKRPSKCNCEFENNNKLLRVS